MKNAAIGALVRDLNKIPGVKALKLPGSATLESGTPDLLIVAHGHPFLIEIKHGRDKPTPIQQCRLDEWAAAGATTAVCWSRADAMAIIGAPPPSAPRTTLRARSGRA